MDTDSSIIYIRTDDIYKGIAEDVNTRSDTSNYELNRQLPKEKNKNVIGVIKDELGRRIIKEFVWFRTKTFNYLTGQECKDKKTKSSKKCIIKRKLKFEDYKNCLEESQLKNKINHLEKKKIDVDSFRKHHKKFTKNNKLILKTRQRFRNEKHNVLFNEERNKIALIGNDDKRIQSTDLIETHAYLTSKNLICKKEETKCNNIINQYKND